MSICPHPCGFTWISPDNRHPVRFLAAPANFNLRSSSNKADHQPPPRNILSAPLIRTQILNTLYCSKFLPQTFHLLFNIQSTCNRFAIPSKLIFFFLVRIGVRLDQGSNHFRRLPVQITQVFTSVQTNLLPNAVNGF